MFLQAGIAWQKSSFARTSSFASQTSMERQKPKANDLGEVLFLEGNLVFEFAVNLPWAKGHSSVRWLGMTLFPPVPPRGIQVPSVLLPLGFNDSPWFPTMVAGSAGLEWNLV